MFSDVLASLRRSHRSRRSPSSPPTSSPTRSPTASRSPCCPTTAVRPVRRRADRSPLRARRGLRARVLVPGDTPLLDAIELDALLVRCDADPAAVGVVPTATAPARTLCPVPAGCLRAELRAGQLQPPHDHAQGAGLLHRAEPRPRSSTTSTRPRTSLRCRTRSRAAGRSPPAREARCASSSARAYRSAERLQRHPARRPAGGRPRRRPVRPGRGRRAGRPERCRHHGRRAQGRLEGRGPHPPAGRRGGRGGPSRSPRPRRARTRAPCRSCSTRPPRSCAPSAAW